MERRDQEYSTMEYATSNPYITDDSVQASEMTVADGYFGGRLPAPSNPYITNTTEAIPDMTVTDGYFNSHQPHQQLPVVHLPDEDPVKVAMPELQPAEREASPRPSQEDDTQTIYSRVSFLSERSTLPPSYTSRRHSYEDEERDIGTETAAEVAPLVISECHCGHPQCISCVASGRVTSEPECRMFWRKKFKCSRKCSSRKGSRKFRFCCSSLIFLILTWTLFGGILWRHAAQHFRENIEYFERFQCGELLPGTYEESLKVPINGSLSTFSLTQTVIYEKGTNDFNNQINVDGFVNVEQATSSDDLEDDEIAVKVEYQVSDDTILKDIDIRLTEDGVAIHTNRFPEHSTPANDVCVFFKVTLKISKSIEISQLLVNTEQLSIQLKPSLSIKVVDKAILRSITGNIWSKARQPSKIQGDDEKHMNFGLQARDVLIETTTGHIRGVWGLADHASFESKSGNIDIGVASVTSLKDMDTATDLSLSTVSGDIAVHSVSHDGTLHPFRKDLSKYNTKIKTVSGDIIGQYLLGSFFSATTISGSIEADMLPISPAGVGKSNEHPIIMETDNKSGKTKIEFLEATDAKVLTEPKSLLKMRGMQTVIGWLDEKRRKLLAYIQKHCDEKEKHKGDIKNGKAEIENSAADIEPFYVDPTDTGLADLAYFKATHTTISGDVFIHYPVSFEGVVKATTLTGEIRVGGDDLKIIKDEKNGPVGKIVEAVHGADDSGSAESSSISGNIEICIGNRHW